MNSKQKSMQRLLDAVVTPESDCGSLGPNRSAILEMVSHERARRRRIKRYLGAAAGVGGCALVALLFLQQSHFQEPPTMPSLAYTAPAAPPPITIHEVDDKQLLELLKGTPVALMEWPDGKRTLIVMGR